LAVRRSLWYLLVGAAGAGVGVLGASIVGVSPRPSFGPALVGFAGVVVGAALATSGEVVIHRLRREDDLRLAEEEHRRQVLRATREVLDDFTQVCAYLETAADGRGGIWRLLRIEEELADWRAYRSFLAAQPELDEADWHQVVSSATRAEHGIERLQVVFGMSGLDDAGVEILREPIDEIQRAYPILIALAHGH
jgi:hypothetical protein